MSQTQASEHEQTTDKEQRGLGSRLIALVRDAGMAFISDSAPRKAAALAFYAILSLAPMLLIAISVAGLFLGQAEAQSEVISQARSVIGEGGAEFIETMLQQTYDNEGGIIATLISVALLFFAASNLFNQIKNTLNDIWHVETENQDGGIIQSALNVARGRLLAALMVLGLGLLLVAGLIASTVVSVAITAAGALAANTALLLQVANFFVSLLLSTLLVAVIFKVLPDVHIAWRDALVGAAITAVLIALGQRLISLYFEIANPASAYGVAGSLVVILLWIYYIANIFFFGAEVTQAYARVFGSKIEANR